MVVDDKIISETFNTEVEQRIFPKPTIPLHTDVNPLVTKMERFGINYGKPHHRMYVYTNVDDRRFYFLRDGMLLPVEYNYDLNNLIPKKKDMSNEGIFVIRYYTIYEKSIQLILKILDYHKNVSKLLRPEVKKYVIEELENILKNFNEQSYEISIRLIDFIPLELLTSTTLVEYTETNMIFSDSVENFELISNQSTKLFDTVVEVDTGNKLLLEIEFNSRASEDRRYLKILGDVMEIRPNVSDVKHPQVRVAYYRDGYKIRERLILNTDDPFKELYENKSDVNNDDLISQVVDRVKLSTEVVAERIKHVRELREYLIKENLQLYKLMEQLVKNETAINALERSSLKDFTESLKLLKGIL